MDKTGKTINAMVYVMVNRRKGIYPPSVEYFNGIKEGYTANGINLEPLYNAIRECCDKKNLTKYNQYNPEPLNVADAIRKGEWVI